MSTVVTPAGSELSEEELERYSRQIVLREVGGEGQLRLRHARVAVVGAGGLGSAALLYLAAAGLGHITILDDDAVSLDNLQRQVLFDTDSLGRNKAEAAAERLIDLNPEVSIRAMTERLDDGNAAALLGGHHVVVEGSDNFSTKFAVNDACVRLGISSVIGGVLRFQGQVVTVPAGEPCYRCLFGAEPDEKQPTCRAAGVLGAVVGMVGSLQATEAVRLIIGAGDAQGGRVLTLDGLRPQLRSVTFPRDPECGACEARPR